MNRQAQIDTVLQAGARLGADARLAQLSIPPNEAQASGWIFVTLPEWARDLQPEGKAGLLVPSFGGAQDWERYDWWRGAFYLLTSGHERACEAAHGPSHSYAFRIKGAPPELFDHAWVNRIILFLRRWWAQLHQADETQHFGAVPRPRIHLTHDVDAISKTLALRIKKAAFLTFNALRYRQPKLLVDALAYMLRRADYWRFQQVARLEESYGRTSVWNVYGGGGGWRRSPLALLMDPGYGLTPRLVAQLRALQSRGHRIGLHQAFSSWKNAAAMAREKRYIERHLSTPVDHCRQHWLRFSLEHTWKAQMAAGLTHDMTLGFNEWPGFRASAALSFTDPYSGIRVTPLVLMDSHIYDYQLLDDAERFSAIDALLAELEQTGGEASIVWHPHAFDREFGWGDGYDYLLKRMEQLGCEHAA